MSNLLSTRMDDWLGTSLSIDNMTGLGNVFALLQELKAGIEEATRTPGTLLALAQFDVDSFAAINKQVGTEAANYMLQTAATTMYRAIQGFNSAKLFRFSGDQFAIVIRHDNCSNITSLVNQVQEAVAEIVWEQYSRPMTLSASLACYPSCAASLGHLLAYTHLFMTRVKSNAPGTLTCPCGEENQDAQQLSIELHNNATSLVEWLTSQVLETASLLGETRQMAFTDPITQLPNLRAARTTLAAMLKRARAADVPLGIMLIDGDKLREYNKQFGYSAGNSMIHWLGAKIRQHSPDDCFVARWLTGDEFIVYCPRMPEATLKEKAEALRQAIESESRELLIPITVSIGLAAYPAAGDSPEELIAAAERANMQAKLLGRNQVAQ